MGWSIGYDSSWGRDIGYGVPACCDYPTCNTEIDRGLSYVCGGEPYGGYHGCGLYFCAEHLDANRLCKRCAKHRQPYHPKPELPRWEEFKMTDPSWEEWRKENGHVTQPKAQTEAG